MPVSYLKLRDDPPNNLSLSADPRLRLIIERTAQTTGIKINFPRLQIVLHK